MPSQKPPLVLIPGLLNDEELWRDQLIALKDVADCHVADITQANSLEAMADDVLKNAPCPSFALAGFSLGGIVAQQILRQAPQRITRLALLDTSHKRETAELKALHDNINLMARQSGKFIGIGRQMLKSFIHPSHYENTEITERIRTMTQRLGVEILMRQNNVAHQDGTEVLKAFKHPALILCGEGDMITPLRLHQEMMTLLPNAKLEIIPEAGHMTPIEQPDQVSRALTEWLMRQEA